MTRQLKTIAGQRFPELNVFLFLSRNSIFAGRLFKIRPTDTEWTELRTDCTWTWTRLNVVDGNKVQSNKEGYTDNWIFLPAAGERCYRGRIEDAGALGYYWSSSLYTGNPSLACYVYFYSGYVSRGSYYFRCYGRSVRPVSE